MFKKTMKFDDLDGNTVEETFYFNFNKKEIAELASFGHLSQFPPPAGTPSVPLEEQLNRLGLSTEESELTQVENAIQAYVIFQDLILNAYGEKSADNRSFVKNDKTREYFRNHVAFVDLIFEFIEDPKSAANFIESCVPAKMLAEVNAKRGTETETPEVSAPPKPESVSAPTAKDIEEMSDEEFARLDPKGLSQEAMVAAFRRKTS